MKLKNCYEELPEGYQLVKEIDAINDKKFVIWFNVIALILMIAVGVITFLIRFNKGIDFFATLDEILGNFLIVIIFLLVMIGYIVLHELTHGISYKLLTHSKLAFGLSLSCAYCGVPNVYVNRKTAIISILAPFTLFSIIFILVITLTSNAIAFLTIILFSLHFGGCIGDLYGAYYLIFCFRNGQLLMKDTGPKQSFYLLKDND